MIGLRTQIMRIQYFSDIHLEFGACAFPHAEADLVIAAGDIAPLRSHDVLQWLSQCRQPLVYVAGNHEYYGGDLVYTLTKLRRQSAGMPRLHFLERDVVHIGDVRVLGTALWTSFRQGNPQIMQWARKGLNDYRTIRCGGRALEPEDILRTHHASVAWLEWQLRQPHTGKTVVVTHHAPSLLSWHRSGKDPRLHAYCNSLEWLAARYPVDIWLHGHTHTRTDYQDGELRVACNARGYFNVEHHESGVQIATVEI